MKPLTKVTVIDKRGTCLTVMLFLHECQIPDYVKELTKVWDDQYGGNTDCVMINDKLWEMPVLDQPHMQQVK